MPRKCRRGETEEHVRLRRQYCLVDSIKYYHSPAAVEKPEIRKAEREAARARAEEARLASMSPAEREEEMRKARRRQSHRERQGRYRQTIHGKASAVHHNMRRVLGDAAPAREDIGIALTLAGMATGNVEPALVREKTTC